MRKENTPTFLGCSCGCDFWLEKPFRLTNMVGMGGFHVGFETWVEELPHWQSSDFDGSGSFVMESPPNERSDRHARFAVGDSWIEIIGEGKRAKQFLSLQELFTKKA